MKDKIIHIFLDESGKPEVYSSKGVNLVKEGFASKFLVIAAVRTTGQLLIQQQVTEFRLSLLKDRTLKKILSSAYTLDSFHAQTDYAEVKEKLKCYPTLQQKPGKLYGVMAGQLLKNICHQTEKTEIIFSRKDSKLKLRQELETEVERVRIEYLQKHKSINHQLLLKYFHNPHYTHGGLQVTDYIAHAVYQVYENNKDKWYSLIKNKIGKIQDICNKKYFTRSNPLKLST